MTENNFFSIPRDMTLGGENSDINFNILYSNSEKIPETLPELKQFNSELISPDIWLEIHGVLDNLLKSLPEFPSPPAFMALAKSNDLETQKELNLLLQKYGIKEIEKDKVKNEDDDDIIQMLQDMLDRYKQKKINMVGVTKLNDDTS